MPRSIIVCAALAAMTLPCRSDEPSAPSETRIRLSLTPAPAPKPALRIMLLPEFQETNPGNPCANYLKCFMEQHKFFFDKETVQRREKLLSLPLGELPAKELLDYGGFALTQADWAARLDTPDWQIRLNLKSDGVAVLLPDLQQLQPLANALKVRFRAEVALGQFENAVQSAKTMFAMARHLGEHPTIVGNLEGLAVANIAIGPLEEMIAQPHSPNLYWALTNLPIPLVSVEKGFGGERDIFLKEFHDLDETLPMSTDQLSRFIAHMEPTIAVQVKPGEGVRAWLDERNKDKRALSAARERLAEYGIPRQRLVSFPADQVLLLDAKREYEVRRDDIFKLITLPMWQAIPLVLPMKTGGEADLFIKPFLGGLHVDMGQPRLDRRIALLRQVEALRLYAAEHNGAFPAKLSEVSVPLPDDPFTGKPFLYEVNGVTAHVRGNPPPGEENDPRLNIHYELTLRNPPGR